MKSVCPECEGAEPKLIYAATLEEPAEYTHCVTCEDMGMLCTCDYCEEDLVHTPEDDLYIREDVGVYCDEECCINHLLQIITGLKKEVAEAEPPTPA